jgi:methylmalonyl-CoA/ethylmalonyl-CoA epimerase
MTPDRNWKLSRLGQIAVTVEDLERAVRFYRDILGLPFLFQVPKLAFFDCAGVRLMLGLAEHPGGKLHNSILYYQVDDIQHGHQTLVSRGVQFVDPPHLIAKLPDHDLWMGFFKDSEGNLLGLMSEVRPPAA